MDELLELAQQMKDALESQDEEALGRIVLAYSRIYGNISPLVDALLVQMEGQSNIERLTEYRALMEMIEREIERFEEYLIVEMQTAIEQDAQTGGTNALLLIATALSVGLGISMSQAQQFVQERTPSDIMMEMLIDGSPLYERIQMLSGAVSEYVRSVLIESMALGRNPRTTARLIQSAFGRGLTDALRMARTAQLYAWRKASLEEYQANADILSGWVWFATLDDTVCQSCIAMHGTIHPLDELLNDHHNGRCAMLPLVKGVDSPVGLTGIEWFESLPESRQMEILGKGKYEAWKDGRFTFAQLSKERNDEVYGTMRVETPLKELVSDE